jgi:hypothetical protein
VRWDGGSTKKERSLAELLARHYRQLRTSHGTVLLGDPPGRREAPPLDPGWFVTGCPLDAEAAIEAIRERHGFATRAAALRALRKARDELRGSKHSDANALDDLPQDPRRA